jgi:hypothetical protein
VGGTQFCPAREGSALTAMDARLGVPPSLAVSMGEGVYSSGTARRRSGTSSINRRVLLEDLRHENAAFGLVITAT